MQCYQPSNSTLWTGREDALPYEYMFQNVQCIDWPSQQQTCEDGAIAVIGFACDEGVRRNLGRVGAAQGPDALRQALARSAMAKPRKIYDVGNIVCQNGDLEQAQAELGELVSQVFARKLQPMVFGGGHEIAWGHYQGLAKAQPKAKIGIINFDAHFDLRAMGPDNKGSSGTPFLQIAQARQAENLDFNYFCVGIQSLANTPSLFKQAEQLNVQYLTAKEVKFAVVDRINHFVVQQDYIYLTLCLDVFAAAVAPGVSAPQACGLYPNQVLPLFETIVKSGKVLGFDIAELSPPNDRDNMTAKLAAYFAALYANI